MPGSCFPSRGEIQPPIPCGREETRRAKAPARPPRTETLEKLSFAPWLFKRFPVSRRFAAEWPLKPASSQKKGEISKRVQTSPFAQKRSKKLSSAPWLFRAFPLPAGGLRPEGPLSRPAARKRKRLAAGHRNGVQRGEALLRIFVYFLFGRK